MIANEDPQRWETALKQNGEQTDTTSDGLTAAMCEVTDLVGLAGWPKRTRLIV